jgi:hypothetical protein
MKSTITLSKADVLELVKDYLEANGYYTGVTNVQLNVGNELIGYGYDEEYRPVFQGITAEVNVAPVKKKLPAPEIDITGRNRY